MLKQRSTLRYLLWSVCLILFSCGRERGAETSSVTNGDLVLGIVPIEDGESGKDQRYRMLVCKKLSEYNATIFADTSKCRSALLTQRGEEVDFVGDKLDHTHRDIPHLRAKSASEARVIGRSPIDASRYRHLSIIHHAGFATIGSLVAILGVKKMPTSKFSGSSLLVGGIVLAGASIYLGFKNYKINKAISDRKKRVNDDAGRNIPVPTHRGFFPFIDPDYSRSENIAGQYWENVLSFDLGDMVSLEKREDLRTILVALARFYKLDVNEEAFRL